MTLRQRSWEELEKTHRFPSLKKHGASLSISAENPKTGS
ncbi:hypothetical protein LEP1GSC132_0833 [Leptospira kirschneri str. 200803703]|uniref:Uncharacterized protein n=2 Tax=Leptospira kirschneri TaxID=29507 RepID=A0A0E2B4Z8_9LEPT|nr:hypothetical protein LEP1GSC081_2471 [Leptospira kirschneri str. H1]EKO62347.1 hypothetical protein LEP1GSC082_4602 [Leptospira kirschneri str. H2]EKR06630.1 hypothetical protein LEP1GSC122_0936 [Leptospira kirschneri serovar Valbuzzi str. 200702274]EMK22061.1 hypothetical protein LEP1GSC008_1800 [Leptospira kirschneri serovar Bulgarica str. Nikolaevo]EMN05340.1 hypothetical protein LEP1GSC046_2159 [Leptospira kirschneri serovar Bim str. 1051]EMN25169.1 hypothetical protein LEP1GSC065_2082 